MTGRGILKNTDNRWEAEEFEKIYIIDASQRKFKITRDNRWQAQEYEKIEIIDNWYRTSK